MLSFHEQGLHNIIQFYESKVQLMIDREQIIELTIHYLKYFEEKNITELKNLFDDDIILFDPMIKEVKGIGNVVKVNQDIFSSYESIRFTKRRIIVDQISNISVGELEIFFDKKEIQVVDIIEFNNDGKIKKITAYFDTSEKSNN